MRLLFRTTSYAKNKPYTRERLEYNTYPSKSYNQYSVISIHHANVFYFAKLWLLSDPAALAVFKLHQALLSFEPNSQTATEFLKLVQFVYDEIEPASRAGVEDSLREVVSHYPAKLTNFGVIQNIGSTWGVLQCSLGMFSCHGYGRHLRETI